MTADLTAHFGWILGSKWAARNHPATSPFLRAFPRNDRCPNDRPGPGQFPDLWRLHHPQRSNIFPVEVLRSLWRHKRRDLEHESEANSYCLPKSNSYLQTHGCRFVGTIYRDWTPLGHTAVRDRSHRFWEHCFHSPIFRFPKFFWNHYLSTSILEWPLLKSWSLWVKGSSRQLFRAFVQVWQLEMRINTFSSCNSEKLSNL